jgi:hypothetical protein
MYYKLKKSAISFCFKSIKNENVKFIRLINNNNILKYFNSYSIKGILITDFIFKIFKI